jgi:hypothetical protein
MFERFIIDWKLDVREIYYPFDSSCSRDFIRFMSISILIYISRSSRIIKQRERQRAKRAIASYTGIIRRPFLPTVDSYGGGCRLFFYLYLSSVREIYYRLDTHVDKAIFRRLFLLFALSLRSFARFAGSFLRRLCRPLIYSFFYTTIIHLTYYRLAFIGKRNSVT